MYVFIGVSVHMCMSIYVCIVFLKKKEITIFHYVFWGSLGLCGCGKNDTEFYVYRGKKRERNVE
jgi:hypothetical protein